MTFDDIATEIAAMTPEQRKQEAYFLESYDDGCAHHLDLDFAEEDKVSEWGKGVDEKDVQVVVPKGMPCFW